jgi:hypothetical protein
VGSSDWKEFSTTFSVPTDCYPQQLALVLGGNAKLDLQATGLAWYDQLQIARGSAMAENTVADSPPDTSHSSSKAVRDAVSNKSSNALTAASGARQTTQRNTSVKQ